MKAQAYLDMMKRQQQELTDFPIKDNKRKENNL